MSIKQGPTNSLSDMRDHAMVVKLRLQHLLIRNKGDEGERLTYFKVYIITPPWTEKRVSMPLEQFNMLSFAQLNDNLYSKTQTLWIVDYLMISCAEVARLLNLSASAASKSASRGRSNAVSKELHWTYNLESLRRKPAN
jgi:hypothetical protein